jgi:hypothetical protein
MAGTTLFSGLAERIKHSDARYATIRASFLSGSQEV